MCEVTESETNDPYQFGSTLEKYLNKEEMHVIMINLAIMINALLKAKGVTMDNIEDSHLIASRWERQPKNGRSFLLEVIK